MRSLTSEAQPPLWQALALGALHGPAELLPISSSGHVALVPWLLGWQYSELDGELRKSFEVALHAGAAAAMVVALRKELSEVLCRPNLQLMGLIGLSGAPIALAGWALERPIERQLGRPGTIASGLLVGGLAIAVADRRPQERTSVQAEPRDALWLGVAQAVALVPGVSRTGATLAAARLRRFRREDSGRLSRLVGLPVIAGATVFKAARLWRRGGLPTGSRLPFALGAAASFASTACCARSIAARGRDRSLTPYALYRIAVAAAALRRRSRAPATMAAG